MKIIIDLQGLQIEGNRKRGIGRYCLDMTKALIKYYPENEYILFTNSALSDLSNDFFDELNSNKYNLIYYQCPTLGDLNEYYAEKYSSLWSSTQLRSYALSLINADIILITSFFDGFRDNTLVSHDKSFDLPPIVSIIYDLIPLIHSEQYLNNDPEFKLFYLKKIEELSSLDGLLAISQSTLIEANQHLDINSELIFNISSACNADKFSLKTSNVNSDSNHLGKFLLYCGAIDPRKNLSRLIEAYALLPLNLICKHKLVLTGPYTEEEKSLIQGWMINFGLPPEYVIFLGFTTDIELVNLYRTCYLLIFPSFHEGFGLPVLEAMNCGAPVIASKLTSLPELIGDQEFLFDPYNVKDISYLIQKSLIDNIFYQRICSNSKERRKIFSWEKTSTNTIESLIKVIDSKSDLLDRNEFDFQDLVISQYNILLKNFGGSPFVNRKHNSQARYLKVLSAAISVINNQSNKIQLLRRLKVNNGFIWHIEGPFDSSYSLAILNRNFAIAMDSLGQNVELFSTEGPGDYEPDKDFLNKNPMINCLYQKSIVSNNSIFICTRNLYPPRVNDVKGVINLLHSYGWEESEFPQQWVEDFNSNLQGISVMSEQVKKILIDNGVYLPIKVTGLGVDHLSKNETISELKISAKKFKILHISSCFPRKGVDILLQAFADSFTSRDDVSLIIKTFDNPHNNIDYMLDELNQHYPNFPDVIVIKDELNECQMKLLYEQSDLFVAPSRGEGFGLPIAEAMLFDVPVITTNFGGQLDFCNDRNCWLIDYKFVPSKSHFNLDLSYWAEPLVNDLSKLLLKVYNSSESDIKKKVSLAKETTILLKWNKVAKANVSFITNSLLKTKFKRSKLGWISSWNNKCGIASYSRNFIDSITEEVIVFSPCNETSDNIIDHNVIPCWEYPSNQTQNLENLYSKVVSAKITSLIIQFNYGFFDFQEFENFIQKITNKNILLTIFLHSTQDPEDNEEKKLVTIVDCLKKCSRLFVHTINDLNRLKKIGLVENVSIFPHPIKTNVSIKNPINQFQPIKHRGKLLIGSYGFCLPNKGFTELIKSIPLLKRSNIDCHVNIFSSIYNNDYLYVYEDLIDLVKSLGVGNEVSIFNNYLSSNQVQNVLAKQDIIVFPYQNSNESSSAAVRDGLASRKPVLVTPLPIFDDVAGLVDYLPGTTPKDISFGLLNWLNDKRSNSDEFISLHANRQEIINQRSFEKLGNRFSRIIKSLEINS